MSRRLRQALCLVLLGAPLSAAARGEEFKGTVRRVDAKENKVVVKLGETERIFTVSKDASIVSQGEGAKNKPAAIEPLEGGLGGLKPGMTVELRTEELDGAAVVTTLKVDATKPVPRAAEEKKPEPKKSSAPESPGKKKKKKAKKSDQEKKAKKSAQRAKKRLNKAKKAAAGRARSARRALVSRATGIALSKRFPRLARRLGK